MSNLLAGAPAADKIREKIRSDLSAFKQKPKLIALQIGENPSSEVYIKNQAKQADAVGIKYELRKIRQDAPEAEVFGVLDALNEDETVTACIVQMPVPKQLNHKRIAETINPAKDAEGMHPVNLGKLMLGNYTIGPCTAMAVMELLEATKINVYGKNCVIVGHSEIVGKPLALLLLNKFATVSVCHIATSERGELADYVKMAEILIVAVGKPGVIKGEWIREGAVVIDVGINRVGDKIVGDVEFESAEKKASYITPVPGGVGPLTTAILMRNVAALFLEKSKKGN